MTPHLPVPAIPIDKPFTLPQQGSWPEARHVFDERSAHAIRAALAAERPLLLRGEPGTGKSQLARAAAAILKRMFISEVVHARSESQDLLWRYDAVRRLGDAQAIGAAGLNEKQVNARLAQIKYVSPGSLWWAFDWTSANAQNLLSSQQFVAPVKPKGWSETRGGVILIDEIDKAEAELPNGLLETLGNGGFAVPWRAGSVRNVKGPAPLVIITTNEERELPAAFVRRCLVLRLALPTNDKEFLELLCARGKLHFGESLADEIYAGAADQLLKDRKKFDGADVPKPGQAEYLDLLRALNTLWPGKHDQQLANLKLIAEFTIGKHSEAPVTVG